MDTIYNNTKAHRCYHCKKLIKKGEGYLVWHYVGKDMFRHFRNSSNCGDKPRNNMNTIDFRPEVK